MEICTGRGEFYVGRPSACVLFTKVYGLASFRFRVTTGNFCVILSVDSVKTVRNSGKICILDIDVQGVMNVKNSSIRPYYIFISPPSMEVLESRLRSRGTEKEEDIAKRIANSKMELEYGMKDGNFDKIITNDDLDKAFAELVETFVVWYPHLTGESNSDVSPTRRPNFFFLALNLLSVYLRLFVSRIRLHFRKHDAVLPK